MAHAQFAIICLIWGASFLLMKKAYVAFGPVTIASARALSGAAILLLLWYVLRQGWQRRDAVRSWPLRKAHLPALLVPALIGFAYPYVMQPHLIGKHQESAFFGMMVGLVPLLTIAVSVPMLGVWPRWREVAGVLVGLGCLAVLASEGESRGLPWYDVALAATVPLAYAVGNTFIKQRFHAVPAMALTCSALALAGLALLPIGAGVESVKLVDGTALAAAAVALGVLGVVGSGLAMFMFYRLIQSHGPLFAGMVAYLIPLGALLWGWLDAERVSGRQLLAVGGILLGVALVQWPGRRSAKVQGESARAGV